jgi:hypothetical protein
MKGFAQLMLAEYNNHTNTKIMVLLVDLGKGLYRICQEMPDIQ